VVWEGSLTLPPSLDYAKSLKTGSLGPASVGQKAERLFVPDDSEDEAVLSDTAKGSEGADDDIMFLGMATSQVSPLSISTMRSTDLHSQRQSGPAQISIFGPRIVCLTDQTTLTPLTRSLHFQIHGPRTMRKTQMMSRSTSAN
jgi:hypothetical protein